MNWPNDELFTESDVDKQKRCIAQKYQMAKLKRTWSISNFEKTDVHFDNAVLHVAPGIGQQYRVWDCAMVLSKFMYFSRLDLKGKNVLELGCGIGLPGMTAAVMGAKSVLLTDHAEAMDWIWHNSVRKNGEYTNIQVAGLEWGTDVPGDMDIVLCSDLIYSGNTGVKALVKTLKLLLKRKGTVVYSAHECRVTGDHGQMFLRLMGELFEDIKVERILELDPNVQCEWIHVYKISRGVE